MIFIKVKCPFITIFKKRLYLPEFTMVKNRFLSISVYQVKKCSDPNKPHGLELRSKDDRADVEIDRVL